LSWTKIKCNITKPVIKKELRNVKYKSGSVGPKSTKFEPNKKGNILSPQGTVGL
jgi:hypothetical protein